MCEGEREECEGERECERGNECRGELREGERGNNTAIYISTWYMVHVWCTCTCSGYSCRATSFQLQINTQKIT